MLWWLISAVIELIVQVTTVFYNMATRYKHDNVCSIIESIFCVIMWVQILILFIIIIVQNLNLFII